jgi:hypothetical protein
MPRSSAAVIVLMLLAAGCENSGAPPREQARAALQTFIQTCADDRAVAASELLTEPLRKRFISAGSGLDGCRAVLGLRPGGALRGVRVVTLSMRPQAATARLRGPAGQTARVELESSDDTWEIAGG